MRPNDSKLTPDIVHSHAQKLLAQVLPQGELKCRISWDSFLNVFILMSVLKSSLFAVVKQHPFGVSHVTFRLLVERVMPDIQTLENRLVDSFFIPFNREMKRKSYVIAIDTHLDPFYGDRTTSSIVGGKKKQGTQHFYGYATAVLLQRRHRLTVGLIALTKADKPHHIVEKLLQQMTTRGLKISGVVMDAGFDSGDVYALLQRENLPCVVPMQRKGTSKKGRNAMWGWKSGTADTQSWTTYQTRIRVTTDVVVFGTTKKRVYAYGGWGVAQVLTTLQRAEVADQWYGRRFGIESSYRQMRESKARTTKKAPAYRLLLVGIGLLLRQLWCWLTRVIAESWNIPLKAWVKQLPMSKMQQWLYDLLNRKYSSIQEICLPNAGEEEFQFA